MITVAEVPEYVRRAEKLLSAQERQEVVEYLAGHPKAGDLMEGTGGVRKLRWRRGEALAPGRSCLENSGAHESISAIHAVRGAA